MKNDCTALGLGDLIITCVLLKQNLLSADNIYIDLGYFTDTKIYNNPINALNFRKKLLNDIIKYNKLKEDVFKYVDLKKIILNQHLRLISNITSFSLNLNFRANKIKTPYIIFHTKCRFIKTFITQTDKNIEFMKTFYKKFKTKYKIILLGERSLPKNAEIIHHNIKTIYNELLLLKDNNDVLDLTKEIINDNLDYDRYLDDVSLIHYADYNIHFGLGGQFVSSLAFSQYSDNIINYIPKCITYIVKFHSTYNFDNEITNYMKSILKINNSYNIK